MTTNEQLIETLVTMNDAYIAEHDIKVGITAYELVQDLYNETMGEYVTTDTSLYRQLMNTALEAINDAQPEGVRQHRVNVLSRLLDDMDDLAANAND